MRRPGMAIERGHRAWQLHSTGHLDRQQLADGLTEVGEHGGGPVYVWVSEPSTDDDRIAREAGLEPGRDLLQLRVALPLPDPHLATRAFVPGADDDAWLAVNNRAFAWHPEQGAWTREMLHERLREPWFDARGFLLHERERRLAGFCWTKVHDAPEALGEIYVIAVDPDFTGIGLGRALTLAGLHWLHGERGLGTGMLYVDASNEPAVGLYRDLGFTLHHLDRAYFRERLTP